jgi:subtilisin family serine protease
MLIKTIVPFVLWLFVFSASGQIKFNLELLKKLRDPDTNFHTVFIKADLEKLKPSLHKFGGVLNYTGGNIASVTIPLNRIEALARENYVQRIELARHNLRVLDDSSLRKNNILKIHNGAVPLTMPYTGKGVVIGIIDTGTDKDHKDFKDSSGKSRIAWLWDQRLSNSSNTPQPYNYGQEWSASQIDSGLCTHIDNTSMSHGTKVAGIAAGNGATSAKYKGVAYDAKIISVAVNFNSAMPIITDALDYIISKASAMGMPFVVNISLGDYYGSHDGKDLESQMISNLMSNTPGRALITAAGNAGQIPFHLGYNISGTDTNFTWITNSTSNINFQVYADSLDFKNVKFRVGCHKNSTYQYKGHTKFLRIDTVLGNIRNDSIMYNNNKIGKVQFVSDYFDGVYALDVTINADSLNYLWSFETNGSGKIDSWNFDYVSSNLPSIAVLPEIAKYKRPDSLKTICTGYQCSDEAITVGNYTNRLGFTSVVGFTTFPGNDGDIFATSSIGPTRDGRIKPEITAGGENIATTGALQILTWLIANYPYVVTQDSMHMIFGGTSASAPVVTGLAALYFEKYPSRTAQQLKDDIINCSLKDSFTGSVPNHTWGYGKLDGFGALTCSMPSTAGLKKFNEGDKFNVYPNPANDAIKIITNKYPQEFEVYNIIGQHVLDIKAISEKNETDLHSLKPGVYILKSKENNYVIKLIKN